ncbi:MAG: hypothetical protein LBU19_04440 [Treponema sp.]|jgi:hypothetical protein|nr:hypothetical protein [Treponema sp.]
MNKRYRDKIAMVTHDIMKDFQQVGAVSDVEMRDCEKDRFVSDADSAQKPSKSQEGGAHNPVTT